MSNFNKTSCYRLLSSLGLSEYSILNPKPQIPPLKFLGFGHGLVGLSLTWVLDVGQPSIATENTDQGHNKI